MPDRRLLLAVLASGLLNAMPLAGGALFDSYDANTHLFFADHYRRAWFDLWEPRWFDGMWMIGYPPLAHQLIALLGQFLDMELAYRVLQAVSLLVFPVAIYQLAVETIGRRYAPWAALLAVGVPGVYLELYVWGQLPSFVGMVLGLSAAAFFARYLRTGRVLSLVTCATLMGAATAAHHHGVIFVMPVLLSAIVVRWWLRRGRPLRLNVSRPVVATLVAGAVAVLAILPFWWWYANFNLPQAELPHPTRDGIFRNPIDAELFFWGIYGAFLVLAPAGMFLLFVRRRSAWPLAAAILVLAALGLGSTTPLPKIVFGYADLWRWLVYERFAVWAAVLCVLPASVVVERITRTRFAWPTGAALALLLVAGVARETNFQAMQPLQPRQLQAWEEAEVLRFLAADTNANWNYVTFGLGEAEMARVSRLTNARTMDGLYYTARQRPELRASGVGSIDAAYWWRTGLEILPQVIQHPESWNLKFAIVAIPQLEEQLQAAGWQKLWTLGSPMPFADVPKLFFQQSAETQAAFRAIYGDRAPQAWAAEHGGPPIISLVSIWAAPPALAVPPLGPVVEPPYPTWLAVWWGVVPLGLLVLALGCLLLQVGTAPALNARLPRPQASRRRSGLALPPLLGALLPWHRS